MVIKKIFLVLILCILVIPVLTFNFKQNDKSNIDNKVLTEFPLGDEKVPDMTIGLTNYISDRIGFRTQAINAYTILNDKLFKQMEHPSYTNGKDGYVFFKMSDIKVNYKWIDEYVLFLKKIQNYCKERNVPFLYCFNPSKTTVYQQYLPKGYNFDYKGTKYLIDKLKENNINFIDNTEMLIQKSKKEQVFNKKYDAGHWNDLGAFYGTNAVLNEIHKDYPNVNSNELSNFNVTNEIMTSLPVSEFKINESVPVFENKRKDKIILQQGYDKIQLNNQHRFFKYSKNTETERRLPKVLLFQGSYLNSRTKYFESKFSEYIAVHNYENVINFDYYFNIFKPEYIVFESAEYATYGTYFNFESMKDTEFNPYMDLETLDFTKVNGSVNANCDKQGKLINIKFSSLGLTNDKIENAYLISNNDQFDIDIETMSLTLSEENYTTEGMKIVLIGKDNIKYYYSINIK